jgi:hypothetical protein
MLVETDKAVCNHVNKCHWRDKELCDHAEPHTLRSYCIVITKCRELHGVFCIPALEEIAPDWEI